MPKFDFKILKQKKGPLPVWAWALIFAGLIYMLYRHFQNSGGGSSSSSSAAPTLGTDTASTAPGDMTGQGLGNAGDLGATGSDFVDSGGLDSGFSGGGDAAGSLDSSQGDGSSTDNSTGASSAPLGLTHISGDYWWDPDNHKLIKIPGSGGAKKGSGKKKTPKDKNKKGSKATKKPAKKIKGGARLHSRIHKPAAKKTMRSPRPILKGRKLPHPKTPSLKPHAQRAVVRTTHPTGHPKPIKKPAKKAVHRVLPKRPTYHYHGKH